MQTVTRILRTLLFVALSMAIVLPASGCGSKKKSKKKGVGLTIAQQLEKAKAEKTADKQAKAMVKVARQQLSSSDKSGAIATVTEARKLIAADGDPNLTGPGLVEVAGFMAELGEKKQAREALDAAKVAAGKVEDALRKARILASIGAIYGSKEKGLSDPKAAGDSLAAAAEAAKSVEERFRAEALGEVALGYTGAGLSKEAGEMVSELEKSAMSLEDARAKAEGLAAAAAVQGQLKNEDAAKKLLASALEAAQAVERFDSKAYALIAVAKGYAQLGDKTKAEEIFEEADVAANKTPEADQQQAAIEMVRKTMGEMKIKSKK